MAGLHITFHPFEELQPKQPMNIEVLEFWKKSRGDAKLPKWSDVDLLDIAEQLTGAIILHCESKEVSRITLQGTRLVESLGIDLTGMNFMDIYEDEERTRSIDRTWALRDRPAAGWMSFVGKSASGGPFRAEVIILPLINDDGRVDRLLLSVAEYVYTSHQPNAVLTMSEKSFDDYRIYDLF